MGQKRSILVVDDDVDIGQMVKMMLEKTGLYTVSVCNRGSEALTIIRETQPEMVLLDIVMPDADGTEIGRQVKEDKSLARIRLVFMTSLVAKGELDQSSMIGGHPFIAKPITGKALLNSVEEFFKLGN